MYLKQTIHLFWVRAQQIWSYSYSYGDDVICLAISFAIWSFTHDSSFTWARVLVDIASRLVFKGQVSACLLRNIYDYSIGYPRHLKSGVHRNTQDLGHSILTYSAHMWTLVGWRRQVVFCIHFFMDTMWWLSGTRNTSMCSCNPSLSHRAPLVTWNKVRVLLLLRMHRSGIQDAILATQGTDVDAIFYEDTWPWLHSYVHTCILRNIHLHMPHMSYHIAAWHAHLESSPFVWNNSLGFVQVNTSTTTGMDNFETTFMVYSIFEQGVQAHWPEILHSQGFWCKRNLRVGLRKDYI